MTREGVLDRVAARLDAAISDMPSAPAPDETAGAFAVGRDGEAVPAALRGAILAIGNFDGVHRGHRALIAIAIREARARRAPAAVLTFEPHPRKFFAPEKPLFRLTPEPAKLAVFRKLGLDGAFVRRFDAGLAGTSAAAFVERLLGQELGASGVVVGHDFHFGKGRQGTPALLEALCREKGWACVIVPAGHLRRRVDLVGSGPRRARARRHRRRRTRSSAIAGSCKARSATATSAAGPSAFRPRTSASPTSARLRHGIYAVRAAVAAGEVYGGVASFGRRPTFDNGAPLLEVHLFDFAGDLYGRSLDVEFVGWIRGEERFDERRGARRPHERGCAPRPRPCWPTFRRPRSPSLIG